MLFTNLPKNSNVRKVVRDIMILEYAKDTDLALENIAEIAGVSLPTVKKILEVKDGQVDPIDKARKRCVEQMGLDRVIVDFMECYEKILTTQHL